MSEALTVRPSWLTRTLGAMRLLTFTSQPEKAKAGADFGTDYAAQPAIEPVQVMSSLGAFVWVYVAVNLCSRDLASIPRKVMRGQGTKAKEIPDHPFIRLMQQPRTRIDGVSYGRQRWADWYLAGNSYDLVLRPKGIDRPHGMPWSLQRLHPGRTCLLTESDGDPRGFEYSALGERVNYGWEDVIWCGGISYEDDPRGCYGQGAIRALWTELQTAYAAGQNERRASKRGRPDFLVRPAPQTDGQRVVSWTREQVQAITQVFDEALEKASGGALVLGGASEVEPLGWSPRDVGSKEIQERVRDSILAAFGIPPSKAGVPGVANYATAQIEDLSYWEARKADATLRDEADSRLAQMMGHPEDRVVSDWSGVRAFQEDRTERLGRVRQHFTLGMTAKAAYEVEGFLVEASKLPEPKEDAVPVASFNPALAAYAAQIVAQVAQKQIPRESGIALLVSAGMTKAAAEDVMGSAGKGFEPAGSAAPAAPADEPARTVRSVTRDEEREAARAARWRSWEDSLRGPAEEAIALRMERFLAQQLARYEERLGARSTTPWMTREAEDLAAILQHDAELKRLVDELGPEVQAALRKAYQLAAKDVGAQLEYEPIAADAALMDDLGRNVQGTTTERVTEILREGIAQGKSVSEIGEDLRRSAWFGSERAMRVARTETTRAVNVGALRAYDDAADAGVNVTRVEWLTARDGSVRDEHEELDGVTVERGGDFEIAGRKAKGPGGFGSPDLDCNCRCTVLPVIE